MGKLSILGAQRVKALQEILEEQKKAELAKTAPKYPSRKETLEALEAVYPGLTDAHELITEVFGQEPSYTSGGYGSTNSVFKKMYNTLTDEKKSERAAVEAKYADKSRLLWLCETLEEAKAIVYGTEVTK